MSKNLLSYLLVLFAFIVFLFALFAHPLFGKDPILLGLAALALSKLVRYPGP